MISFASRGLLDFLDAPSREVLASFGRRQAYRDGERIHSSGDPEPTMGVVLAGSVRMTLMQADGRQSYVTTVMPGQHFGDVLMFSNRARTHDAFAIGAVEIDHYDAAAFSRLLDDPVILRALYEVTARRLSGVMAMNDDLRLLPREVHLAKMLTYLGRSAEGGVINCLQEELAAMLGISTMTLAKALATLKREGLVETGYRQVRVLDVDQLQRWMMERAPV